MTDASSTREHIARSAPVNGCDHTPTRSLIVCRWCNSVLPSVYHVHNRDAFAVVNMHIVGMLMQVERWNEARDAGNWAGKY